MVNEDELGVHRDIDGSKTSDQNNAGTGGQPSVCGKWDWPILWRDRAPSIYRRLSKELAYRFMHDLVTYRLNFIPILIDELPRV